MGVIVIAQKLHALVTQGQDLGDDGVVVVCVAIVAAIVIGAPDFLAQITLVGIGQERVHGGAGVEHRIFALMAALGGEVGGGGDEAVRQARQLVLAQIGDVVLFVGQHIVGELRVQLGQTRLDLGVALGFRALKGRAVAGEAVIGQLNKTLLVRAQRRHFLTVMDGLDAGEQVLVLGDFGREGGQHRRHLTLDLTEFRRAQVRRPDAVIDEDAVQGLASPLHGDDGVLERRRFGIVGDLLDLGAVAFHADFQRFTQIAQVHLVKGRHAAIRAGPFGRQRIGGFRLIGHGGVTGLAVGGLRSGGLSVRSRVSRLAAGGERKAADGGEKQRTHEIPSQRIQSRLARTLGYPPRLAKQSAQPVRITICSDGAGDQSSPDPWRPSSSPSPPGGACITAIPI